MSCNTNCCPNFLKATSITVEKGITTITVPAETFKICGCYCIGLFTSIPVGTDCTQVIIASGTNKYNVLFENGNYWRPCELKCRSILKLQFLDDPAHFIIKQVKGKSHL